MTENLLWYDSQRLDSFHEYINIVYGEYPNIKYKFDLDIVYKLSEVSFRFENSYKNIKKKDFVDAHLANHMVGLNNEAFVSPHKDYEWVEVSRSSTGCLFNWYYEPIGIETPYKKKIEDEYTEGLGKGRPWPEDEFFERRRGP